MALAVVPAAPRAKRCRKPGLLLPYSAFTSLCC